MTLNTYRPLSDPRDIYPPIDLDDSSLEQRRAFLQSIGDRSGALDDIKAEQAIRAAAAKADVEARRGA